MKNRCFIISVSLFLVALSSFSQVGINTSSPDASAVLDIVSTTKGFLPPRMSETDRDAIGSPAAGLTIYNTDTNAIDCYNGSSWQSIGSAGSYVDLTTNQSISGVKTFNGNIVPVGRMMMPMGELNYFNTGGSLVSFSSTSNGSTNMVAVSPASNITAGYEFDNGGANDGILRYTGTTTKKFHIAVTISGTPQNATNVFVFGVALNGGVQTAGKVIGSSTGTQFSSLHIMLELSTNDTIQLYIGNTSASGSNKGFTVKSLNIFAMGI